MNRIQMMCGTAIVLLGGWLLYMNTDGAGLTMFLGVAVMVLCDSDDAKIRMRMPTWEECEDISNEFKPDESFIAFNDDPTADNATSVVRDVIMAYLKGDYYE